MSAQQMSLIRLLAIGMSLVAVLLSPLAARSVQDPLQDPPVPTRTAPANTCSFGGPLVHVPSKSGGNEGLLVRVSPPVRGRYPQGAPIAVHMIAARPSVSGSRACLSEQGFVDVGFLCPGGEYRDLSGTVWKSGGAGVRDQSQAQDCVEPLADVLAFATGRVPSTDGKSIQEYVTGVRAMTDNAGVIGWSFGGNLAVLAMAQHGSRFPDLKWYASWETPILGPVDDGRGTVFERNPFYDSNADTIDFSRLRYSNDMPLWVWPIIGLRPPQPRGGLYLDDGNGRFNRDADFAFWVDVEPGPPLKVFYSPMVTREALEQKVFGDVWPSHIATVEELDMRARNTDALRHIPQAIERLPRLAVLVFESQEHHIAGFGGARHVNAVEQVNAWLAARARWIRFSPDVHYVTAMMGKAPARSAQYPAMKVLDGRSIAALLEPEAERGGPTDNQAMTAVVSELADRTHFDNWAPTLTSVLVR